MGYPHYSAECVDRHDVVRDFAGPRPTITVLCGSTRFSDAFREANLRLTVAGHIVLSIGCDMKSDHELWADPAEAAEIKIRLDDLHRRKIELADEVYVLNVGGYIGESTRAEIAHAEQLGRPVKYLEPLPPPVRPAPPADPCDECESTGQNCWEHGGRERSWGKPAASEAHGG